ncbi:MAG: efflux transporter outer membrane subunit [Ferrovum sp.]|nr:efflux transporter outer membrane subunit [Ferrovum sp.]NDU87132.1 efflux transporter outer membrane subunit [Ferrovum sp.]
MNRGLVWGVLSCCLAGCSLAPTYERPSTSPASRYQESGPWAPFDAQGPRPEWWQGWHDSVLDGLENAATQANQNLRAAQARVEQARALARAQGSALMPSVNATASHDISKISQHTSIFPVKNYPSYQTNLVGLDLNYELDLWGALRNATQASEAQALASEADMAALNLSIQAEIAVDYQTVRALDATIEETDAWVSSWQANRELTQTMFSGGEATTTDTAVADLNWQTARQQVHELQLQRQQMEHAVALLVGASPDDFRIAPAHGFAVSPLAPAPNLPSTLLERRPDIAAAEQRVMAANANIGVARAAFFPVFSLTGAFGYGNTGYGPLISAPNRVWSVGPGAALPLFDGGLRQALSDQARAQWDESVAQYRNTVLTAWKEVEDQLTAMHELELEYASAHAASEAADTAFHQAQLRYQVGLANQLEVLQAQRVALSSHVSALTLRLRQVNSSIIMIKALGGGWSPVHAAPSSS